MPGNKKNPEAPQQIQLGKRSKVPGRLTERPDKHEGFKRWRRSRCEAERELGRGSRKPREKRVSGSGSLLGVPRGAARWPSSTGT